MTEETPCHKKPVVYTIPGMDSVEVRRDLLGFTFNHQYNSPERLEQSIANVIAAVEYVRQHAGSFGLDPDHLCLWSCSGGGPHISFALRDRPAYVRCVVLYYTILDLHPVDWLVSALGREKAPSLFSRCLH